VGPARPKQRKEGTGGEHRGKLVGAIGESARLGVFVQVVLSQSYMKAYRSVHVPMMSEQGPKEPGTVRWAASTIQGGREHQEDRWRAVSSIDCTGGGAGVGGKDEGWSYTDCFGVFDGHGGAGVSTKVARELPSCIARQLAMGRARLDWAVAVLAGFRRMEHKITCRFDANTAPGSTAVVVLVRVAKGAAGPPGGGRTRARRDMLSANLGDSRAVLCSVEGVATALSLDHSCDLPEERRRIERAGGTVTTGGLGPSRVNGQLAMARSFGRYPTCVLHDMP
jgi:serine/threonine protein phosphatase PrpC